VLIILEAGTTRIDAQIGLRAGVVSAKSQNDEFNFDPSRGDGGIDRGITDHGRIAASDGELGHGEKDGPNVHKVPHCTTCAK
jgi:hypothetical protein